MILVECLYTSNEVEEETILRQQQAECLATAASYGWSIRRQIFEPLLLSKCEMKDRSGIQTILSDAADRALPFYKSAASVCLPPAQGVGCCWGALARAAKIRLDPPAAAGH